MKDYGIITKYKIRSKFFFGKNIASVFVLVVAFFSCIIFTACKVSYSFTGASISPDTKTVAIQYFPNRAPNFQPILSQEFTEALKDKFTSQTSLQLINSTGDLNFEGEIKDYRVEPLAIQQNQTASLNRLTITVRVKFSNSKNPKQDFDTSFSRYEDYESSKSLDSVEKELIKQIVKQLVEDIFNKSVVNW
ncbi:MAG: LptE family protein [Bacteroidia bacterium]|nr:LptE family protein [Bacteroidia bacterium]